MLDRYDQDLLLDYLEDELDADRRAQLDAMLAEDPQLATLLIEMAKDRQALRSLPHAEAPAGLVHDATHAMERRMLLDDTAQEDGPIPLSRGRGLAAKPTRSISWGRVIGLTGLAASVALVAGILVITFDDPLERTANELADNVPADTEEAIAESTDTEVNALANDGSIEGVIAPDRPDRTNGPSSPGVATVPADLLAKTLEEKQDEALALGREARSETPGVPPAVTKPNVAGEDVGDQPAETLAFVPTAAISAIQPQQQLVLFSESPEISLELLFEFCVANGIPVVKPDQLSLNRDAVEHFGDLGQAVDDKLQDITDGAYGDYALLINDAQLDTLVTSLNNDVSIKPENAGKASVFSNQAALLTDLPKDSHAYRVDKPRDLVALGANSVEDVQPDAAEQAELSRQQPAIQLRSPDLGSSYANERNAYNLQAQQQAGYSKKAMPLVASEPAVTAEPAPAEQVVSGGNAPETEADLNLAETEQPKSEGAEPLADQDDTSLEEAKDKGAFEFDRSNREAQRPSPPIDPTRGNWLSAHLPMSDTTPLLMSWREGQLERPTKLVPVMIQRAESDQVNTLRQRQQVEFANRRNQASTDSKTKVGEDAANKAAEQTDTEPSEADAAEAKPSKSVK